MPVIVSLHELSSNNLNYPFSENYKCFLLQEFNASGIYFFGSQILTSSSLPMV